jgi:predicted DNA-binding antitoxin AbrB/MazE fold protein
MEQVVTATLENGALKPDGPLNLPRRTGVRILIQAFQTPDETWEELQRLLKEAPINSGGGILNREQMHQ